MRTVSKDKVLGCLVGGAVGDALGYPVEFLTDASIRQKYGESGITRYELARKGVAVISDDTQMTLFTANGLLNAVARCGDNVSFGSYMSAVTMAYLNWYDTQCPGSIDGLKADCWLHEVKDLQARRAPGNTCLSALQSIATGRLVQNNSKGCGGIMRVAPIAILGALKPNMWSCEHVARLGGNAARLTHQHELGFLPSALFTYMIYELLLMENPTAEDVERIIREGGDVVREVYPSYNSSMNELMKLLEEAIFLAHSNTTDAMALEILGEGWVAEETLAVAVYCTLRYMGDFEKAVVTAVNHSGDSDSTGAVTGNLIGAMVGYEAVPGYYKEKLEMLSVIEEIGDDLYATSSPETSVDNAVWRQKYC